VVQFSLTTLGALSTADLQNSSNWNVFTLRNQYKVAPGDIQVVAADSAGAQSVIIKPDRAIDFTGGPLHVLFRSGSGDLEAVCDKRKLKTGSWVPRMTADSKDADISLTGALQTAVGNRPQYSYAFDGKYDFTPPRAVSYAFAATFKALASQQTNADPDSMKLAANFRYLANLPGRNGLIVTSDLIAYEFARTLKNDKQVVLNQPGPQYIEKNSNRVHSAQVTFVRSERFGSFEFCPLGIEGGTALTRTVKAASNGVKEMSILRGVFGADYYNFWAMKKALKRIDFEAHHTQRILHFAEPYKRSTLNDGKQFLSRYARPISTAKLTFTVVDGFGISFSYLRGSLPPTFQFVDHQLTLGLTILLKRT
jgi:hypothetical protein